MLSAAGKKDPDGAEQALEKLKSKPLLRYEMISGTSPYIIEVYCHAAFEVYAKIVVNGQWIGGDNFQGCCDAGLVFSELQIR